MRDERLVEAAGMGEGGERAGEALAQMVGEPRRHRLGRPAEMLGCGRDAFGREIAKNVELQAEIERQTRSTLADRRRHVRVRDGKGREDRGHLGIAQLAEPIRIDHRPPIADR